MIRSEFHAIQNVFAMRDIRAVEAKCKACTSRLLLAIRNQEDCKIKLGLSSLGHPPHQSLSRMRNI